MVSFHHVVVYNLSGATVIGSNALFQQCPFAADADSHHTRHIH